MKISLSLSFSSWRLASHRALSSCTGNKDRLAALEIAILTATFWIGPRNKSLLIGATLRHD